MISSPCSRAGERAHPTKLPPHHTAKPPDIASGGFAADHSLRTFHAFPLRGRWRGGHAATDEVFARHAPHDWCCFHFKPSPRGEGGAAVIPRRMRCRWVYTAWPVSVRTFQAFPLRGRWRGGHAATDEVSLDIHRMAGIAAHLSSLPLEGKVARRSRRDGRGVVGYTPHNRCRWKNATFPPHPASKACHLLGKEKAAHAAAPLRPLSHIEYRKPPDIVSGGFLHLLLCSSCAFSARSPASAAGSGSRRSWR